MNQYLNQIFNLENKVVLLTGAGGHIVSALSRGFAKAGCLVAIADMRLHKAEVVVEEINNGGGKAIAIELNVAMKTSWETALETVVNKFGSIDVLLNGAGMNAPTPFFKIELEEWNQIMETNLTGTLLGCQIVGSHMISNKTGSIINISSASAGPPLSKAFAYSASKEGVKNLTQNVAREFALYGVRVNSLRPGFFPTEWNQKNFITDERRKAILNHTPMGRFGVPEELVGAVLWMASDAAKFVTGSEICVDGGFLAMTI
jgi:NAD(P)-dependent dehydrogenase (short-subunit alcohol dehydrogenase family)